MQIEQLLVALKAFVSLSTDDPYRAKVLRVRLGMDDGVFKDINKAADVLGISPYQVRQNEEKALKKLKVRADKLLEKLKK